MLVPSEDIAVAVLMNGEKDRTAIMEVVDAIFKVLLPKWEATLHKPETTIPPFTPGPDLLGAWKGTLRTYQKDLPVTLKFLPSGDVQVHLAHELASLLNNVQFKDGWLSGEAWGDMATDDAERHRANTLLFSLKLRGNHLNGAVSANERGYNPVALTQWLDVEKQP